MGDTAEFWLRFALICYSAGLIYSFITVIRQRRKLFRPALAAFTVGAAVQLVSIVDAGLTLGRLPVSTVYQMASVVGFCTTLAFLTVYWRYKFESLAVFVFPTVFLLTFVSILGTPVEPWGGQAWSRWWLGIHVVLFLLGYAALSLTSVAGVMYLIQEKELKSKRPSSLYHRLPPLGVLDEMALRTLGVGFVLVTLGLIVASWWAVVDQGPNWIVDPTIALAFVSWLIYLALVFGRITIGWRGRKAAYLSIVGFCFAALTWIVNSGVHSFMNR